MRQGTTVFIFTLILIFSITGCSKAPEPTLDDKLKNGYFAMCYTPEFAQRFSLPVSKAMDLSHGLQAIAVEVRPAARLYETYFHLYIDSRLALYSPGGECDYYRKPEAESFFPKHYSDIDYKWNSDFIEKAGRRLLFRSQSLNRSNKGVEQTLQIDMFKREFLPGLSLLSTSEINSSFIDKQKGPGELLVQKRNVGDYLLEYDRLDSPNTPKNYYVFKIPEKLHKAIQPYLEHIDSKFKYINESRDPLVEFP